MAANLGIRAPAVLLRRASRHIETVAGRVTSRTAADESDGGHRKCSAQYPYRVVSARARFGVEKECQKGKIVGRRPPLTY